MTTMTGYQVMIATGNSNDYGPKIGWDEVWRTRKQAEECAARASRNSGWSAKIVEVEEVESTL